MVFMGWEVKCHPEFAGIITDLYELVAELKKKDPAGYKTHPKAKLLARIYKIITEEIPSSPSHPLYFQGNTLGPKYRGWKRAKFDRYRLFFKYSGEQKLIIDAWLNDDSTLRQAGSKNDPYQLFKKMLDRKIIQDDFAQLEKASICPWNQGNRSIPTQLNPLNQSPS